ncbi:PEP-CTERM sorting domain-containing protein [Ferribacterium limneticum]|nr:PEP-CTERM sorting domain-containing protein [Ferribacterium limneticum]
MAVGYYSGSGIGLSTSSDALNIFNASGALQAKVTFGASDSSSPYQSFDNAAGLNNTAVSQLSVVGINGAFVAANSASEIGSPGSIAAVPEPETYAMLLAGLGLIGAVARKRQH